MFTTGLCGFPVIEICSEQPLRRCAFSKVFRHMRVRGLGFAYRANPLSNMPAIYRGTMNSGKMQGAIRKPESQEQGFSWLHGFLLIHVCRTGTAPLVFGCRDRSVPRRIEPRN